MVTVRLARLEVWFRAGSLYVATRPRRNCPDCRGEGGWWDATPFGPEPVPCRCIGRTRRIPLRPQRLDAEPPF